MQSSPINCLLKCNRTLTHIKKEEQQAQGQNRRIKLHESHFQQRDGINKENEISVYELNLDNSNSLLY